MIFTHDITNNFQENRDTFIQWIEHLGTTDFIPYAWTVMFHPKITENMKKNATEHAINLISRKLHPHPDAKKNTRVRAILFPDLPSPQWKEQKSLRLARKVDRREAYGSHLHGFLFIPSKLNHKVPPLPIKDSQDNFFDSVRAKVPEITKFHREHLYTPAKWLNYCNKGGSLRKMIQSGEYLVF